MEKFQEGILMQNRWKLARQIFETSHIKGEFRLRSGAISEEYFDKYLFEADPILLGKIARAMSELIPEDVDVLAGLEMGGIPIATLLSQVTGVPTLFIRKTAKTYGTCKFAEGGEVSGRRVVIVEDVVTSGGQIRESVKSLRELGAEIVRVICVIDREAGGRENLAEDGLELHALFTMTELKNTLEKT